MRPGDFTLLLGSNGTGKTTLMRICAGLLRPDSGDLKIDGQNLQTAPFRRIGHSAHQPMLYAALSVRENLEHAACLMDLTDAVSEKMKLWNLDAIQDKRLKDLSRGEQGRAALCRALLADPEFVFLDEPTSSLDEKSVGLLLEALSELRSRDGGKPAVFTATHDITRLLKAANRVAVLEDGVLARDSSRGPGKMGDLEEVVAYYRAENR